MNSSYQIYHKQNNNQTSKILTLNADSSGVYPLHNNLLIKRNRKKTTLTTA